MNGKSLSLFYRKDQNTFYQWNVSMIIPPLNSSLNNLEIFTRVSGFLISSRKYTHNWNTILPEMRVEKLMEICPFYRTDQNTFYLWIVSMIIAPFNSSQFWNIHKFVRLQKIGYKPVFENTKKIKRIQLWHFCCFKWSMKWLMKLILRCFLPPE